jgi:nucleoid-associated protein YgaU
VKQPVAIGVAAVVLLAILVGGYYMSTERTPGVPLSTADEGVGVGADAPPEIHEERLNDVPVTPAADAAVAVDPPATAVQQPAGLGLMDRIRQHQQLVGADMDVAEADQTEVSRASGETSGEESDAAPVWTLDGQTTIEAADAVVSEPELAAGSVVPSRSVDPSGRVADAIARGDEDQTIRAAGDLPIPTVETRTIEVSARDLERSTPTYYTIQPDDTFTRIAVRLFGAERYWADIAQANPTVDPVRIRPGQVIQLPDAAALESADEPAPPPPPTGAVTYVVQAGDTLTTIARRHYDDARLWRVIYLHNRGVIGSDENRIQAGMRLVIPPKPPT